MVVGDSRSDASQSATASPWRSVFSSTRLSCCALGDAQRAGRPAPGGVLARSRCGRGLRREASCLEHTQDTLRRKRFGSGVACARRPVRYAASRGRLGVPPERRREIGRAQKRSRRRAPASTDRAVLPMPRYAERSRGSRLAGIALQTGRRPLFFLLQHELRRGYVFDAARIGAV